jgi:hypothetical protein
MKADNVYLIDKDILEISTDVNILTSKIDRYKKFYETLMEVDGSERLFRCELHTLIVELVMEKSVKELKLRDLIGFRSSINNN